MPTFLAMKMPKTECYMVMPSDNPRILIFSQRNIFKKALFRCAHYEFEYVISQIDSAEILAPEADPLHWRHNFAKRIAYHAPIALNPGIQRTQPKGRYELVPGGVRGARRLADGECSQQLERCLQDIDMSH